MGKLQDVFYDAYYYESFFNLVCALGLYISFLCGVGLLAEAFFLGYQLQLSWKTCSGPEEKNNFILYNALGFIALIAVGCLYAWSAGVAVPIAMGLHYALATQMFYMAFVRDANQYRQDRLEKLTAATLHVKDKVVNGISRFFSTRRVSRDATVKLQEASSLVDKVKAGVYIVSNKFYILFAAMLLIKAPFVHVLHPFFSISLFLIFIFALRQAMRVLSKGVQQVVRKVAGGGLSSAFIPRNPPWAVSFENCVGLGPAKIVQISDGLVEEVCRDERRR
jgi:hypothetical protein